MKLENRKIITRGHSGTQHGFFISFVASIYFKLASYLQTKTKHQLIPGRGATRTQKGVRCEQEVYTGYAARIDQSRPPVRPIYWQKFLSEVYVFQADGG
jgi:hypothetical protein